MINLRLAVICMAAACVGLSMVLISIAKLSLVVCGLAVIWGARSPAIAPHPLKGMGTPLAILLALLAFALSLFWTVAPSAEALGSLAKYGKLLAILLMLIIVRDRREATCALGAFVGTQTFLLASSWMLFAQLPVPWATSRMAASEYSVFSSYLDQGIMSAVFAAVCWHLREMAPGRWGRQIAVFLTFLALANVFFVLRGRSGHAVAIALVSMAIMWEIPKKYRAITVLLPFLLAAGLFFSAAQVRERFTLVQAEIQSYSVLAEPATSSGIRLNFWRRALQSIDQHRFAGSGVGSWSTEFNRLQRAQNPAHAAINPNSNPHQEYLIWGVQLGIPGVLIFLALLAALLRDTRSMEKAHARAAQSTVAALAVACLFNASLYDAQIGDFFCILLGLLLALGRHYPVATPASTPFQERPV